MRKLIKWQEKASSLFSFPMIRKKNAQQENWKVSILFPQGKAKMS